LQGKTAGFLEYTLPEGGQAYTRNSSPQGGNHQQEFRLLAGVMPSS
jgi:hypothetical protein